MARRSQYQATDAAKAASEAARVLQQRGQEARNEVVERVPSEQVDKTPPEGWTPPERSTVHSQALEEIVAKREKDVVEEPAPEPVEAPKEEPKAEVAQEPVAAVETAPEAPKVVRVKVDGEEFDAPADEVEALGGVKAYQILKASENRFKKSNDVLAEIRKAQAEMLEQAKAQAKPKEPEITDEQLIVSKLDAIRFGTPEEGAAAFREILSKANKPIDANAIIEQAANRIKHDQAVAQFDTEFQDITSNPLLLRLVVSLRNERIPQQKGQVDWGTFYRTIGNEVRSVSGKPTSQPAAQSTTSGIPSQQSDKEARKAAAVVTIPTAAARATPPQEEKEESRADLIKEMRKKRGLPVD